MFSWLLHHSSHKPHDETLPTVQETLPTVPTVSPPKLTGLKRPPRFANLTVDVSHPTELVAFPAHLPSAPARKRSKRFAA